MKQAAQVLKAAQIVHSCNLKDLHARHRQAHHPVTPKTRVIPNAAKRPAVYVSINTATVQRAAVHFERTSLPAATAA